MPAEPEHMTNIPGYAPEEVVTSELTRHARLKWAIIVDATVSPGQMINAVACIAATTGDAVAGLIGPGGQDGAGRQHPGLPWAGCTVVAATPQVLASIGEKAASWDGVFVVDMPAAAQAHRIYDDYLADLAKTAPEDVAPRAVSIIGPRNRIDKLVKKLALLA